MTVEALAVGPAGFGAHTVRFDGGPPAFEPASGSPRHLVCPGLVDVHIHGGFGVDLMAASPEDVARLADRLRQSGYEAALATTVSCGPGEALRMFDAVAGEPLFCGLHLEGPFLSEAYPGAQRPEAIAAADPLDPAWGPVFDHPSLRIATLAPERPGCAELAARLAQRGVLVAAGHSGATFAEAAVPGVSHATHCFNAMRPFHHREAGVVGAALTNDAWTAELIYDRAHVSREAADVLRRCKPKDKLVAVSDGTMASGMPEGSKVAMWGLDCTVRQGTVRIEATGTLAGSAVTLLDVFRNLHADFGPELAVRACAINPRPLAGAGRAPAVWLVLDAGLEIVERIEVAD